MNIYHYTQHGSFRAVMAWYLHEITSDVMCVIQCALLVHDVVWYLQHWKWGKYPRGLRLGLVLEINWPVFICKQLVVLQHLTQNHPWLELYNWKRCTGTGLFTLYESRNPHYCHINFAHILKYNEKCTDAFFYRCLFQTEHTIYVYLCAY